MQTGANPARVSGQIMVWWVMWFSLISGLCILYFFLGKPAAAGESADLAWVDIIGLLPLLGSAVVRWLVLPKCGNLQTAFVAFILGISLAEACGILAIFLGGAYRNELFVLGVLGIAQFVPFYARRFYEPESAGNPLRQ